MKSNRWKVIFISALTLWGLYSVAPTFIYFSLAKDVRNDSAKFEAAVPDWLPKSHVKLGLDLQGGVQLVLGVETSGALENKLSRVGVEATRWAEEEEGVGIESAFVKAGTGQLTIKVPEGQDIGLFNQKFKKEFVGIEQIDRDGNKILFGYSSEQIKSIRTGALEQAERVIRSRVDKWGVAEPVINRRADGSILVQLPGFKDPGKAKELLGRTAQLKFSIVDDTFTGFDDLKDSLPEGITFGSNGGQNALIGEDRQQISDFVKGKLPDEQVLVFAREQLGGGTKYRWTTYVVNASTELTGEDIFDANVSPGGQLDPMPQVSLRFTGPGGKRFGDITGRNIKKRMAIILDDVVESAPVIQGKINGGNASITLGGGRAYNEVVEEATDLVLILKSGAIPADIEVLEERQVGASLGPELANQGVKGVGVGLVLVLVFMLLYYRRPGVVASLALVLNGLLLLALMGGFGFAFTLPGIAGFILTLGMAVDANVLINERIRQELREGKNAKKAVENGFNKVFWTIIDANVTTLIAAMVLMETNSSGPIRGFAVTLMIGLIVSVFTSLFCSRVFFDVALAGKSTDKAVKKFLGADSANKRQVFGFDFIKRGSMATVIAISLGVLVLGTGAIKGINWGVDFAGGTEVMLGFEEEVEGNKIREVAGQANVEGLTVQALGGGKTQYLLRFDSGKKSRESVEAKAKSANAIEKFATFKDKIMTGLAAYKPEILRVDYVGPQIGRELRAQGIQSIFWAILGIFVYILMRFDLRFGPGAVVKMTLDVCIMLGFYVFFNRTFDLTSVAAFLTVVGYSVNDTIVIYDRIRENITLHSRRGLRENINISLNETISRTINTSVTTVGALTGILIFGTGQIWNFAMAMTIGVIVATLSSMFVASSFVIWSENWQKKRAKAKKKGPTESHKPAHAR